MRIHALLLAVLALPCAAAPSEEEVPATFEYVATSSADALTYARQCLPGVTEGEFRKAVPEEKSKAASILSLNKPASPTLVVTAEKTFCLRNPRDKFPLLAHEALDDTVNFPGMPDAERLAFQAALLRQLAIKGSATALLKTDRGTAFGLTYLLPSRHPVRIYYQMAFLNQGDFDETRFDVVTSVRGNSKHLMRGQPAEGVKSLFVK